MTTDEQQTDEQLSIDVQSQNTSDETSEHFVVQTVIAKRRKIANVFAGEPWVYPNAIIDAPDERALVHVVTEDGKHVGFGDYNPDAPVRVRLLTREEEWMGDKDLIDSRLHTAFWRRVGLGLQPQGGAVRLVNGEGDGLPGIVVDSYGANVVIDLYSAGMRDRIHLIKDFYKNMLADCRLYVRMGIDAAKREGVPPLNPETVDVENKDNADNSIDTEEASDPDNSNVLTMAENGVLFTIDIGASQKTGFFIDQRDNRRLIARFAQERRVLDLFCYHGGFALSAIAGGAASALAIDSSEGALATAAQNAENNGFELELMQCDVFKCFERLEQTERRFDLIICDPPKLAPRRGDKERGLRAYRYLVDRCLKILEPNGILLLASCSQAIGTEDLRRLLAQQGEKNEMNLDVLAEVSQPADHPWPVGFPTGRYLSSLIVHRRMSR